MKKLFLFAFLLLFLVGLASADLCKGSDGYYHDCDGVNEWADGIWGDDSSTSSYSYGGYYEKYDYKQEVRTEKKDRYGYEKTETIIINNTEKKKEPKRYKPSSDKIYLGYKKKEDKKDEVDCSYWRCKEPYDYKKYKDCECEKWECTNRKCVRYRPTYSSYRYPSYSYYYDRPTYSYYYGRRDRGFYSRSYGYDYGRRCASWECTSWKCVDWDCEDYHWNHYYYKPRYSFVTGTYNWRW
jgi:hypothetical protein